MIHIRIDGATAIVSAPQGILRKLYNELALPIPYAMRNPKLRNLIVTKRWDGKVHFLNRFSGRVPTGLVPLIEEQYECDITGHEPGLTLARTKKYTKRLKHLKLHGIEQLGDFQQEAIRRAVFIGSGPICIATNGGKTEVAAGIIKVMRKPTLYIVHLKALLHQTAERLAERTGYKIGKLGDGEKDIKKITVAMVQSLPKLIKANRGFYDQFEVLFIDEAQHGSADTWYKAAMFMKCHHKFALSGTPWTGDDIKDMKFISVFGPKVLARVKNAELIDRGWSAKPTIHMWPAPYPENDMRWRMALTNQIINNNDYNEHVVSLARRSWEDGKTTLIIVNEKQHGIRLYRRMLGEKIDVAYLTGASKKSVIHKTLARFKAGKLGVILCTPIFDEGVDVPAIRTLILPAGGKSSIRLLQRVGRALRRKKSGKNVAEIHDFIHYGNEHLLDHTLQRINIYEGEDFDIKYHKEDELLGAGKKYDKANEIDWHRFHKEESK